TSRHFADLLSNTVDSLATIDPHLHRFHHMHDLYTIPAIAMHAAPVIAAWIKQFLPLPLLIGPDEESMQWVKEVADLADAPFIILTKTRLSDTEVQVSNPHMDQYPSHTPVLVDDIISTAHTMIETVNHLKKLNNQKPVCIGVHAIFAGDAYQSLLKAGAARVITCNTIAHASNGIGIEELLAEGVKRIMNDE
ncbi:MAG: ribose-phosphate diphosphokinase, partial [Hymenobacteraceae bacterium]|nr:ribose-phosphate diphosphokinase [Hymenobacteraceae bacterium]